MKEDARETTQEQGERAGCFRHFFSYVPPDPWPDVPEVEPPDPNSGRALPDSVRTARRSLIAVSALALTWSAAQFSLTELSFSSGGVTIDLQNASVPLLLGVAQIYLAVRYGIEFGMMERNLRRWRMAQLDFRVVSVVTRFSFLALAAGAVNRSLWSVVAVAASLAALAITFLLLSVVLAFVTTPIRMWARDRAERISAANSVIEGFFWAGVFAAVVTAAAVVVLGSATYRYAPLRTILWPVPPDPVAFTIFVVVLIATFLSHWLLRPVVRALFAVRPSYFTTALPDGDRRITFVRRPKEPLL